MTRGSLVAPAHVDEAAPPDGCSLSCLCVHSFKKNEIQLFPEQCVLQASHPWCSWQTAETDRILAERVQRAAHSPDREPLVLRVSLQRGQRGLLQKSTGPKRPPLSSAEAPRPRRGGRLPLLRVPEPGCRSRRHPQRPPGQHRGPAPGRCQQRRRLLGHRRQRRRQDWQVKTCTVSPVAHTTSLPQTQHNSSGKLCSHLVFIYIVGQRFNWTDFLFPVWTSTLPSLQEEAVTSA